MGGQLQGIEPPIQGCGVALKDCNVVLDRADCRGRGRVGGLKIGDVACVCCDGAAQGCDGAGKGGEIAGNGCDVALKGGDV